MKEDRELAVEVLHIVLDNIAYENKDVNGKIIPDYQIYPIENSHKQIMYRQVYKNHLFGLLFNLKLIKTRKGRGNDNVIVSVVNDAMKWNSHLKDNAPYEFSMKLFNPGGRYVFLSISDSTFDNRPKLEQTHLQFLQKCRKEFIAAIFNYQQYISQDLDTADTTETTETETSSESESERKRPADTQIQTRRLKTHRIEGGSVTVQAPPYCKVTTKFQYDKIQDELSKVKRALEEKCAEFETLRLEKEELKNANERLTAEYHSLEDQLHGSLEDIDQKNHQIKTFQAQLDKEKELVRELQETIQDQKEKVKIADKILTLATKEIRIQQKIEELTASIERNEHLKVANGRAKPRRKEDIKPATIEKPVNQTGLFKVTNFSRKAQMKYIVEEIICLCIENGSLVSDDEIKTEKERLKKIKKVKDLKVELRAALGYEDPEDGKDDKKTQFKVQSQLTNSIGGAAKLRDWKDTDEKALIRRN